MSVIRNGILLLLTAQIFAGTSGSIAGRVQEKDSNKILIGANVLISNSDLGTMSDESGRFLLTHIAPGTYTLRISYIGYKTITISNVRVISDHRTDLIIKMEQEAIKGETVDVINQRPLIQKDVTATVHFITSDHIKALPIQSFTEIVDLQPGVAAGHIRGGRKNEVLYLIDDIPIADAVSGNLTALLGKDAIEEMSVQTGGFNAEYGNAMSGVVKIKMKSGSVDNQISLRSARIYYSENNLFIPNRNNSTIFDLNYGGQFSKLPMQFFFSWNFNRNEFARIKESFGVREKIGLDPDSYNWNGAIKLNTNPSSSFRIMTQILLSYSDWREYEHKWFPNRFKLPWQGRRSIRYHLEVSHSLTSKLFYTIQLGQFHLMRQVYGKDTRDLEPIHFQETEFPYIGMIEDPFSFVISGDYPWWTDHEELQTFSQIDLSYQYNHFHQIKGGFEWYQYDLYKRSVLKQQISFGDEAYYRYFVHNVEYDYSPNRGSIYIQDKIDYDGLIANIGLRYDYFDPMASRPALEQKQLSDSTIYSSTWIINYNKVKRASVKHQLSPRIGIAQPITADSEIRINYGYFFQLPLFDYLYTNADYSIVQGFAPLGDPDLQPSKTVAIEIGYKQSFENKYLLDITIFEKDVTNLVDVNTYVHEGSYLQEKSGISGLTRYINLAYTNSRGLELLFKFLPTNKLDGYFSYTYMHVRGTASNSYHQFEWLKEEYNMPNKSIEYDLSWDQRHTFISHLNYKFTEDFQINIIYRWNSPLPYTADRGAQTIPNNSRMQSTSMLDIRIDKKIKIRGLAAILYFELLNTQDQSNILWMDRHSQPGGILSDPSAFDLKRRFSLGITLEKLAPG